HLFGKQASAQRRADPMSFVRGDDPPMLLVHGTDDREVRAAGSVALARKALAMHDDAESRLYPGVGHMDLILALSRPMRHHAPTLGDVLAFIHAHERTTTPQVASRSTMDAHAEDSTGNGDVGGRREPAPGNVTALRARLSSRNSRRDRAVQTPGSPSWYSRRAPLRGRRPECAPAAAHRQNHPPEKTAATRCPVPHGRGWPATDAHARPRHGGKAGPCHPCRAVAPSSHAPAEFPVDRTATGTT